MEPQEIATIDNRRSGTVRRRVLCGYAGVAGPVVFAAASVVAALVQTSYSWRREDLSALGALDAQHAWIMITGSVVLGTCTMALSIGLRDQTGQGETAALGPIMLFVAGAAIVGDGLMRSDCSTELRMCADKVRSGDVSWHDHGHNFASIVLFLVLMTVPLVFADAFRSAPAGHGFASTALSPQCCRCSSSSCTSLARSPVAPGKGFSSACSSWCRSCGSQCSALGSRRSPTISLPSSLRRTSRARASRPEHRLSPTGRR